VVHDGPVSTQPQDRDVAFAREKARRTLPISVLVLLAIIAMYLPLPKRFVALAPLVIAVVLSIRLLQFLRNQPGRERVWPVVTLVLIGLLVSNLAVQALFYEAVNAYEQCVDTAQTSQAAGECEELRRKSPLGGTGFPLE
jgi:RsiW-degrading membrane proteinase PrsW (M82 family)